MRPSRRLSPHLPTHVFYEPLDVFTHAAHEHVSHPKVNYTQSQ